MDDDKVFEHESYGLVQFSHRSGNPKLFHSALENHYNYVTLLVKTAKLRRSDTGDRVDGPMHGNILEVDLSAAQFAELLTTMNIGSGIACTIRRREGKQVEPPPDIDTQTENLRSEFKVRAKEFTKKILSRASGVTSLLKTKDKLSKADRESISGVISSIAQELSENIPFFVDMYQEATEKITTAAKAEVEAFMVGAVHQAGLAALAAGKVEVAPPRLPPKEEA